MADVHVKVLHNGGTAAKGDSGRLVGFTTNDNGAIVAIIKKFDGYFVYAFLEDICDINTKCDANNKENTEEINIYDGIRW